MRTRIKICGITRPEDAMIAAEAGADAIGMVFYPDSPRAVTIQRAREITAVLPPFITVVALFVNAGREEIQKVLENVRIDTLQFHGDEQPEVCNSFYLPYIKALRMHQDIDLLAEVNRYQTACGVLLDSFSHQAPGGTGEIFDWKQIPAQLDKPVILAGGLTPENVGEAVRAVRPYAVDVSSGVEKEKGIKDEKKVRTFIENVISQ
jgi:phosphoribosylanthranilate isomerase